MQLKELSEVAARMRTGRLSSEAAVKELAEHVRAHLGNSGLTVLDDRCEVKIHSSLVYIEVVRLLSPRYVISACVAVSPQSTSVSVATEEMCNRAGLHDVEWLELSRKRLELNAQSSLQEAIAQIGVAGAQMQESLLQECGATPEQAKAVSTATWPSA